MTASAITFPGGSTTGSTTGSCSEAPPCGDKFLCAGCAVKGRPDQPVRERKTRQAGNICPDGHFSRPLQGIWLCDGRRKRKGCLHSR